MLQEIYCCSEEWGVDSEERIKDPHSPLSTPHLIIADAKYI
jgi:hypothetical protein